MSTGAGKVQPVQGAQTLAHALSSSQKSGYSSSYTKGTTNIEQPPTALGSSHQTAQASQVPPLPYLPNPATELRSIFLDAMEKYKQRTQTDLTNNPLIAQLEQCKTVDDIAEILEERTSAFADFREGTAVAQLMRRLKPMVNVIFALGQAADAVGEGVGIVWAPGKAIIGAMVVLLGAIRNVSKSYDALMELLECVSNFLARLEIYAENTLSPEMKDIIVKVLVEVISIFGLATEHIRMGRFKKYVKTLLGNTAVEDSLRKLNSLSLTEAQMTGTESLRLVYRLVTSLNTLMQNLAKLRGSINMNMVRDCRDWLSPPDPSTNHVSALNTHHEGTAAWFTEGEIMGGWKTMGSVLWIRGKPGSGKTVFCSAIIEDLKRHCLIQPSSNVRGVLSHLLVRISAESRDCTEVLFDLYSKHGNGSQGPGDADLRQCLEKMLRLVADRFVYIIIDALDECPNSGVPSPRNRMLALIKHIVDLRLPNVRICLTSRPEPGITAALDPLRPKCITLDEESGQNHDMSHYVRSIVDSDDGFMLWREGDKTLAVEELSRKGKGMFRWVSCQLDTLRGCLPSSVRDALQDLPETLDETYQRILKGLNRRDWKYAHRILQCLTVCTRPLYIMELADILAVDVDSGNVPQLVATSRPSNPGPAVLSLCSTLVVIHPSTTAVQFAHFSVQEYLLSERLACELDLSLRQFHIVERHAHATIAKACLGVLLHLCAGDKSSAQYTFFESPLARYSALYWVDHANFEGVSTIIQEAMMQFFQPGTPFIALWRQLHDVDVSLDRLQKALPTAGGALYYASLCGFRNIVEHILARWHSIGHGADVNAPIGTYGTALAAASSMGRVKIVNMLIEHGVDVNAASGEYGTALCVASYGGQIEVVRLLLGHGADVNAQGGKYGTALAATERQDMPEREVATLLRDHGARDTRSHSTHSCSSILTERTNGVTELFRSWVLQGRSNDISPSSPHFGGNMRTADSVMNSKPSN
ncbi:hypothetical protein CERSUDRAFT_67130 [Gelatoporia subvermispora B]|uniref:NACHT domain-containing protein n=1 Tax=Ceriporiopsis subvermispora (strain B) TaxID=914234 RepID=M2R7M3_CERS8|nr:hypothetical protein CERSUDRAFT_67130 [Gelatoporia subvermispora B]